MTGEFPTPIGYVLRPNKLIKRAAGMCGPYIPNRKTGTRGERNEAVQDRVPSNKRNKMDRKGNKTTCFRASNTLMEKN